VFTNWQAFWLKTVESRMYQEKEGKIVNGAAIFLDYTKAGEKRAESAFTIIYGPRRHRATTRRGDQRTIPTGIA